MNKNELINLAKELSKLDNFSTRGGDILLLKREAKKFNNDRDDESFHDKELADEFNKYYAIIAEKEGSLSINAFDEKTAIIAKAKALLDAKDIKKATKEMDDLFTSFKSVGRCTKEQDDAFWAEFKDIKDKFFEKRRAYYKQINDKIADSKTKKETIIEEAKKILELENMKEASNKMNALMDKWKEAGFAGKDHDQNLWEEFSKIRKEFFNKMKTFAESMKSVYEERVVKKEELIKKARILLANSTFTKDEVDSMKALRGEWKQVGFAGKENDDDLWKRFSEIVDKYFFEMKSYR